MAQHILKTRSEDISRIVKTIKLALKEFPRVKAAYASSIKKEYRAAKAEIEAFFKVLNRDLLAIGESNQLTTNQLFDKLENNAYFSTEELLLMKEVRHFMGAFFTKRDKKTQEPRYEHLKKLHKQQIRC